MMLFKAVLQGKREGEEVTFFPCSVEGSKDDCHEGMESKETARMVSFSSPILWATATTSTEKRRQKKTKKVVSRTRARHCEYLTQYQLHYYQYPGPLAWQVNHFLLKHHLFMINKARKLTSVVFDFRGSEIYGSFKHSIHRGGSGFGWILSHQVFIITTSIFSNHRLSVPHYFLNIKLYFPLLILSVSLLPEHITLLR